MNAERHPLLRHLRPALPPPPWPRQRPPVSFIVCTRDRLDVLEACIDSIRAACRAHPAFAAELVVVDNGSRDGTASYLLAAAATSDIPLTAISEARPGLAAARNAGLAQARGGVLVFVDDDCRLDRNYLADLERHYASGEKWLIRGGRVEIGDALDLPFTIKRCDQREVLTHAVHPGGFVLGCNMTMHRDVAARIGPFDERFGAGGALRSAEDTDYLVRAMLAGMAVEYVPDMTIFHYHGRRDRMAIDRLHRDYHFGNGALCLKHLRRAPWLLRHFYWAVRAAMRELVGGPRFDQDLKLSHWPIVLMNLAGAAKFMALVLFRRPDRQQHGEETTTARAEAGAP
ncbi:MULTISPECIES: glycosyltransferase [unclassified Mesorhizobium]|uniref:glycosyltransferase family 2 protein n=1 Tax=unclassified Mesorhizobium TaxID=325217 RepID=UPI000FDA1D0C|nr:MULTISPECIES: glycosyltransferase [unclassified Mesorhizobium]TGQ12198.1 glycosyltransferase [Mesorhizobium sp. M2E.F.Ca.ET.219.01.1.1]TGT68020.1 glycosyltransferase [Mesorhizobium sp. M2E.F.Ca.ET.166.01.1.1]TGW01021.1 glycosyltransferase [Mesorhizobium sp. M2E.F.Ca.ET.154.01.1.1]